jgi:hypothetical protein
MTDLRTSAVLLQNDVDQAFPIGNFLLHVLRSTMKFFIQKLGLGIVNSRRSILVEVAAFIQCLENVKM